ncbi:MAG: glycosyltransferase family 2 protein, partial [Burkholderiales bacterium]
MNVQRDFISVVIAFYNGAPHVKESIESALGQTHGHIEVIVVVDDSKEGSLAVVEDLAKRDNRLKVVSQRNRGISAARNRGLEVARGEFIAFLDAADYWAPECLEKLHRALAASDAVLAYCGWQNMGVSGGISDPFVPRDHSGGNNVEKLLKGRRWPVHAALIQREAVEGAGGFDERWILCADYGLWLKVVSGNTIVSVPEILAFHRYHDGQTIKNRSQIAKCHWRIRREFIKHRPEIAKHLGHRRIRDLVH